MSHTHIMYVIYSQQVNADVTNENVTCRNRKQITDCGGEGGGNKEGEIRSDCRQVRYKVALWA